MSNLERKPGSIVAMGEILVEIMATERGQSFRRPGTLIGPYASGAPAIFIDQVAKLGSQCALIGCVGDDDFGALNIERLRGDGVDVSGIAVLKDATTGSAFVTYREDGDRDFIYNITNSASAQLSSANLRADLLAGCGNFHVMGSSLFSFRIIEAMKKAIETVKANGGTVSFDPNIRKEMLRIPEMRDALDFILDYTDVFLPSGHEVTLLASATSERGAIDELLRARREGSGREARRAGLQLLRRRWRAASAGIHGRGNRSDRRGRLLRRDLRRVPRAGHGRRRRAALRLRERRAGGRREGSDGRHGDISPNWTRSYGETE